MIGGAQGGALGEGALLGPAFVDTALLDTALLDVEREGAWAEAADRGARGVPELAPGSPCALQTLKGDRGGRLESSVVRVSERGRDRAVVIPFPDRRSRERGDDRGDDDCQKNALSAELACLLDGAELADAFELDRRLRAALSMEQRLSSRTGPLLASVLRRGVHRMLGFSTRAGYVRERLGLDPSWGRALLRVERAAQVSPAFARAYRSGAMTALQATCLVPLVVAELGEVWVQRWVERARGYTLRRLRDDVEGALLLQELDFQAWRQTGGLPGIEAGGISAGGNTACETGAAATGAEGGVARADANLDREIGAGDTQLGRDAGPANEGVDREIGARTREFETCTVRMILESEVAQLWRALLCSVRRRMAPVDGRLPTTGRALGLILDHVLDAWGAQDEKVQRSHRVFARDGWRCVVPGCTSMRNLHDHHVVFRSAGGSDAMENRTTLCAFHHLRGVHAGIVRCSGRAPEALRFELGVRSGREPLVTYAAGDRVIGELS